MWAVIGAFLQIVAWILNAWEEANDEKKKQKTKAIQSGVRGIIDHDASRINIAFQQLRDLKK